MKTIKTAYHMIEPTNEGACPTSGHGDPAGSMTGRVPDQPPHAPSPDAAPVLRLVLNRQICSARC